jgi:ribokinase
VDTVGAGDCFCGVLAAALAAGLPVPAALRRASAAAALSTTRHGAQDSMPTAAEVDAFLAARG